jgi:hypothetical protein
MKTKIHILVFLLLVPIIANLCAAEQPTIVNNTLAAQSACSGKLVLSPIRTWGGDEEEDLKKVIKYMGDIEFDANGNFYICANYEHCVRLFNPNGEFIRQIGRRGKGPGDLLTPISIELAPNGDLMVLEMMGRRVQRFNPSGKSVSSFKIDGLCNWIGVTSQNDILSHFPFKTFKTRKIIYALDHKGKTKKEFGQYHGEAESRLTAESFAFALDSRDNVYVANRHAPVIRKYSPNGTLLSVITFETPFKIPNVTVQRTEDGEGVKIINEGKDLRRSKITQGKGGAVVSQEKTKGDNQWLFIILGMATDSQDRLYIMTKKRLLTPEESKKLTTRSHGNGLSVKITKYPDPELSKTIENKRILVFDPTGKVIAETPIKGISSLFHINNDRLYLKSGVEYNKIHETHITFSF